jgi:hypothetical protein
MADIRSYPHPGKYQGGLIIDEVAHLITMDGADDECGDVSEQGEWYGLLYGPIIDPARGDVQEVAGYGVDLNSSEATFLAETAGCIVREDDQGFVSVEWYETPGDLDGAWIAIVAEMCVDPSEAEDA